MAQPCTDTDLLLNSGTSQAQRQLEALLASYVSVDERTDYSTLILFAKKYGAYLNFYNLNNVATGDWQDIMGTDVAVTIATVGTWNTADYTTYINNLYDYIPTPDTVYTSPAISLKYLFDLVASIATAFNQALTALPSDVDYLEFLTVAIGSKLAVPLAQLINYYNQFVIAGYIDTGISTDPNMPVSNVVFFKSLKPTSFVGSAPWVPASGVSTEVINLPIDGNSTPQSQIANSSLFQNVVSSFINGVDYIVSQTETAYIQDTLTNYPNHVPQYGLFLAFLRLFHTAQDHLNHYTERHLEFYYKKVLQLNNAAGVPDIVHLVFQLQKNTPSYLLAQGMQLQAGKDPSGNSLFYALTDDIVLNQSSVSLMRSLFLLKGSSPTLPQLLYASPQANTSDGQGGKLTSPDQSWYPFGDLTNSTFTSGGPTVGFAIASNLLYLNEGQRTISLTFNCTEALTFNSTDLSNLSGYSGPQLLSIQFTGNKKWFNINDFPGSKISVVADGTFTGLIINIVLSGTAPPIIPYSQKIHGGNFSQALPMVQIQLDVQAGYQYYAALKSLLVSSVTIDVTVDSVQNLVLQNKDGKIDPSKPFKPFGEYPPQGSPFIVGSKEIFQKKISSAHVNLTWQTTPGSANVNELILVGGQWQPGSNNPYTENLATNPSPSLTSLIHAFDNGEAISPADFTPNTAYDITSVNGFIQLQLNETGYDIAPFITGTKTVSVNASQPVTNSDSSTTTTYTVSSNPALPSAAPVAVSVNMDYHASDNLPLDSTQANTAAYNERQYFFYHIEPFGYREMHPYLLSQVSEGATPDVMSLLPVFNLDDGQSGDNGGELWIGLAGTQPAETQSILFQVSEGTANPLKNITTVVWYYMSNNNWVEFDSPIDYTNDLSQSGLVVLNLQGDETTNNTRADAGYLWIKAVVQVDTDAVCKIIAVLANAARAQFVQTALDSFTANIPEKTISKLAVANGAIKQINQPYPSSGGKPVETNIQFQQRVSERLRHKNRAVTSWDYERLVLQNFPQIHKVKCLNHTTQNTKTQNYSELKPGTVMVITVPDLSLVTGSNPLLPFTNIGLLATIKEYLDPLTSPFVHLEVCNPQFEGVELEFCVTFINGNADSNYYKGVLNNDIAEFMMPWAYGSQGQDIEFGGKIEKSALLSFIQKRPYVDYVTCFKMNQYIYSTEGGFTIYQKDVEEAIASTARSILVPYSDPVLGAYNNITSQENCNCNG